MRLHESGVRSNTIGGANEYRCRWWLVYPKLASRRSRHFRESVFSHYRRAAYITTTASSTSTFNACYTEPKLLNTRKSASLNTPPLIASAMARTRSKPALKSQEQVKTDSGSQEPQLPESDQNPARLFVLPTGISEEARIVPLNCPATNRTNQYFFCPAQGLYEFTRVSDAKSNPRSWLIASRKDAEACSSIAASKAAIEADTTRPVGIHGGYISKNPDLYIATPIDELFIILPILAPEKVQLKEHQKKFFLTLDDHLDAAPGVSPYLSHVLRHPKARRRIELRMDCICDMVEAGEDRMYRLSTLKLADELRRKANAMVAAGLPASMEERFVTKALQAPVLSVKNDEYTVDPPQEESQTGTPVPDRATQDSSETSSTVTSLADSQTTSATSLTSISDSSAKTPPAPTASDEVVCLLRLRTALTFIMSSYIPPHLRRMLQALINSQKTVDFTLLDTHLSYLAKLRAEAQALRSLSDNISRKRGLEDDEAVEVRAEKKRKKEEEEKKKKMESRGLKDLKKADISGMKKLSNFFQKAATKS